MRLLQNRSRIFSRRQGPRRLLQSSLVRRSNVRGRRLTRRWSTRLKSAHQLSSRPLIPKRPQVSLRLLLHKCQSKKDLLRRPTSLPPKSVNQLNLSVRLTPRSRLNSRLQMLNMEQLHLSLKLSCQTLKHSLNQWKTSLIRPRKHWRELTRKLKSKLTSIVHSTLNILRPVSSFWSLSRTQVCILLWTSVSSTSRSRSLPTNSISR